MAMFKVVQVLGACPFLAFLREMGERTDFEWVEWVDLLPGDAVMGCPRSSVEVIEILSGGEPIPTGLRRTVWRRGIAVDVPVDCVDCIQSATEALTLPPSCVWQRLPDAETKRFRALFYKPVPDAVDPPRVSV